MVHLQIRKVARLKNKKKKWDATNTDKMKHGWNCLVVVPVKPVQMLRKVWGVGTGASQASATAGESTLLLHKPGLSFVQVSQQHPL